MKKQQIENMIIMRFKELTSWEIKLDKFIEKIDSIHGHAKLSHPKIKDKIIFSMEIKNEVGKNDILKFIQHKEKFPDLLILAQYISKPNREQMRNYSINYIDSSGNCYIEKDSVFINIENQKVTAQRQTNTSKLYTEGGMRFVYKSLLDPEFINNSYRQISSDAEIALGNVGSIIDALKEGDFLQIKNDNRFFKRKNELFDIWANNFADTMRPHLFQTRMAFANTKNILDWKNIKLKKGTFWGGEPAAALLDNYLIPEQFVLYSNDPLIEVMKEYRLVPDQKGNVLYMLAPFKDETTADPFLIYAELILSKDSRCLEAAKRIKEKYIDTRL